MAFDTSCTRRSLWNRNRSVLFTSSNKLISADGGVRPVPGIFNTLWCLWRQRCQILSGAINHSGNYASSRKCSFPWIEKNLRCRLGNLSSFRRNRTERKLRQTLFGRFWWMKVGEEVLLCCLTRCTWTHRVCLAWWVCFRSLLRRRWREMIIWNERNYWLIDCLPRRKQNNREERDSYSNLSVFATTFLFLSETI